MYMSIYIYRQVLYIMCIRHESDGLSLNVTIRRYNSYTSSGPIWTGRTGGAACMRLTQNRLQVIA